MFLGWYDPDRKKPPHAKLAAAIARYQEKFGHTPRFCLTSAQDAAELAKPSPLYPDGLPLAVEPRAYVGRSTFYVGEAT